MCNRLCPGEGYRSSVGGLDLGTHRRQISWLLLNLPCWCSHINTNLRYKVRGFQLGKVCLSRRLSLQPHIVHCTLCGSLSCRLFSLPWQKWACRGIHALGAHWGIHCLELTCPPFTSVCFAQVARAQYLERAPCRSGGGKSNQVFYFRSRSSRDWRPADFQPCVVKLAAAPFRQCVYAYVCACVWWWSWSGGKTSSTRCSAVPLACSCSSPVVACALHCGQTAACDSSLLCNVRVAGVVVGVSFDSDRSLFRHTVITLLQRVTVFLIGAAERSKVRAKTNTVHTVRCGSWGKPNASGVGATLLRTEQTL